MLSDFKLKIVQDLVSTSTKEELIWMNGYFSGLLRQESAPATQPATTSVGKITIVYGTETGNSKKVATDFALKAKKNSINAKVVSLDQYRLNDLPKEEYLLAVISTQGEGEPPASAKRFYDHIHQNGFKLEKLKYGVLALGDTSYPLFCKAGEDVDSQLEKLGGKRFVPIQKCDVDYESEAEGWFGQVLNNLSSQNATAVLPNVIKKTSGKKIYKGTILSNILLNDIGSAKETHHIEISADDVDYLPGDALGIIPIDPETGKRLTPRLYSISSSPEAHSGEIHLTVARCKFYVEDDVKYGICSDYLTQLPVDTEIEFYIHKNLLFKLPEENRDIIMIGPGTGVAPFRSFIAQRDAQGATGKNWLFFGDQHFVSDFLYQTELQNWVETGVLTKLNVAFSRDQKEKIYVQHKMLKHGADIYNWLLGGASLYVCGAKNPMSVDVEDTLFQIVQKFGNKTVEEAAQFVELLKDESRYLKDVY
jgi:sulfite reductase alpha subunit-like flavoprotein